MPTKKIIGLPLPTDLGLSRKGVGLLPPGPTIFQAFGVTVKNEKRISVRIGKIYLDPVVIKSVIPTFSKETDENGYPIFCRFSIEMQTIFTATTNMIEAM